MREEDREAFLSDYVVDWESARVLLTDQSSDWFC